MTHFEAILFDLDGTLVDSEAIHFETNDRLLSLYGHHYSPQLKRECMGVPVRVWIPKLVKKFSIPESPEILITKRKKIFASLVKKKLTLTDGAIQLLNSITVPIGLGTSAEKTYMDWVLKKFDMKNYFRGIVGPDDVKHRKPNPEVYITLAKRLNATPSSCLVIEDAPSGIEAAKSAGATCWALRGQYVTDGMLSDSDRIFESLSDVQRVLVKYS